MARPWRVLFACVGNSARSQMAQGFARALGGGRVDARSGGSRPLGLVLPEAIAAMREKGIDISAHRSQGFDEAWIKTCDLVVTMGCGEDACPAFAGRDLVDWDLPDPHGQPMEVFRRVRDDIETRVRRLLETVATGAAGPRRAGGHAESAPGSNRGLDGRRAAGRAPGRNAGLAGALGAAWMGRL